MALKTYLPSDEQLKTQAKITASNYFVDINKRLSEVYKSPDDREKAQQLASVEQYVEMGGEDFEGLRISLRDFESKNAETKKFEFVDFDVLERLDFNLPLEGLKPQNNLARVQSSLGTLCISAGMIVCVSWGSELDAFEEYEHEPHLEFDRDRYEESLSILKDIKSFAKQNNFQELLNELYSQPVEKMNAFVHDKIINEGALRERGVEVPDDIIVQRSAFADDRPTLFCITKYASNKKTKLTITYDAKMIN